MSIKETGKRLAHMPKVHMPIKGKENPTELFERVRKFRTLEEVEAALQEGIYGSK